MGSVSGVVEIRPFLEADRAALRGLFGRAGEGAPPGPLWGHAVSEAAVYLDPYMALEPGSLFVAVADGALVGYLAGCLDGSSFPSESERVEDAVKKHHLIFRPRAAAFFARAAADSAWAALRREPTAADFDDPRWPAHLHTNVAPEARGTGVAHGLMERWLERLKGSGSPGCHLQTLAENPRVVRFFERTRFVRHLSGTARHYWFPAPGTKARGSTSRRW